MVGVGSVDLHVWDGAVQVNRVVSGTGPKLDWATVAVISGIPLPVLSVGRSLDLHEQYVTNLEGAT